MNRGISESRTMIQSRGIVFWAAVAVIGITFGTAGAMPVERRDQQQGPWPWLTNNHYRFVMQCQPFPGSGVHKPAWIELDFEAAYRAGKISSMDWNPDSIRVVEYDAVTQQPVQQAGGSYFVPAKVDEWARYTTLNDQRKPHLSWIRRSADSVNAVYICYFDMFGRGEQQPIAKPAYIGTGDALAFGTTSAGGYLRGVPFVVDWDGDGHKDILTSMQSVPERQTYVFRNTGNSMANGFEKARGLGTATGGESKQVIDVDGDGRPDLVRPGGYYPDFINNKFTKWVTIHWPSDSATGTILSESKTVNWYIADWDNDGKKDVIAGCGWWGDYGSDYGIDGSYDANGNWTSGPLRGWFYLFRNTGSNQQFVLQPPVQLKTTAGVNAEVYGYACPVVADIDNDGDLDLISGDFLDKIWIFRNIGTRSNPQLSPPQPLATVNGTFVAEYQALKLYVTDWDDDGDLDIFFSGENTQVGFLKNTGAAGANGLPLFEAAYYPRCREDYPVSGMLATINCSDWDNDGDADLIFGNSPGKIGWYRQTSGYPNLTFAEPVFFTSGGSPIRIEAGANGSIQGPAEARWGYTVPHAADWDGDGYMDILTNSIWGKIVWYKNPGVHGVSALGAQSPVLVEWPATPPKPAWNWWNPAAGEWVTQWRSTVQPVDYDQDGLMDAVALDTQGYLVLHRRTLVNGVQKLLPGQRIFLNADGAPWQVNAGEYGYSGRRKFVLTDWDNDGDWDLIMDKKVVGENLIFYQNVTGNASPKLVEAGSLLDINLIGHETSAAVFDLEGDGNKDLLACADEGHYYCFHRSYIENKDALKASFMPCPVFEPFDYPALVEGDSLTDADGGVGFSGGWKGAAVYDSNNLSGPSGYGAQTTGGSLACNTAQGTSFYRNLNFVMDMNPATEKTYFVSMLMKFEDSQPAYSNEAIAVRLSADGSSVGRLDLLGRTSAGYFTVGTLHNERNAFTPGKTYLLIAKIVARSGANDSVQGIYYGLDQIVPAQEPTETQWDLKYELDSATVFNRLQFGVSTGIERLIFDEIRIGTSWQQVTEGNGATFISESPLDRGLVMDISAERVWTMYDPASQERRAFAVVNAANNSLTFYSRDNDAAPRMPAVSGELNGRPVFDFDGVDDYLVCASRSYLNMDGFTVAMVLKIRDLQDSYFDTKYVYRTLYGNIDGNGLDAYQGLCYYQGGYVALQGRTNTGGWKDAKIWAPELDNRWIVLIGSWDGYRLRININNSYAQSTQVNSNVNGLCGEHQHTALGRDYQNPRDDYRALHMDGQIARLMIFNRALSAAQEKLIGSYLADKYGLTTGFSAPVIDNCEDQWRYGYGDPIDADRNCVFDIQDFAALAQQWLGSPLEDAE